MLLPDNFPFEPASQGEFSELAKLRRRLEAGCLQHLHDAIVFLEEAPELVGETFHQIAENHLTNREASIRQDVFETELIAAELLLYQTRMSAGSGAVGNFAQMLSFAVVENARLPQPRRARSKNQPRRDGARRS